MLLHKSVRHLPTLSELERNILLYAYSTRSLNLGRDPIIGFEMKVMLRKQFIEILGWRGFLTPVVHSRSLVSQYPMNRVSERHSMTKNKLSTLVILFFEL